MILVISYKLSRSGPACDTWMEVQEGWNVSEMVRKFITTNDIDMHHFKEARIMEDGVVTGTVRYNGIIDRIDTEDEIP